ncbi:hypothetical protein [Diaphorobacter sp. HDW4A]|uniref:hypothetical protein n=1 Tax=Diaphorobacter sp. HDW4A TaxID=2714924 RepID=UPI001F0DAA33|nr:hypothetical protein [Diaphorobacter sp. HDW4A]
MATRLLATIVLAFAILSAGYWWGHTATDNAWIAKQAKKDKAADDALAKANARADKAAGNYLQEHLDQEDRYAILNAQYSDLRGRVPLVVHRPVPVAGACANNAAPQDVERSAPVPVVDSGPGLTLAAVRMWNGSLSGVDAPAGACGLAGTAAQADAACAQDSGLTIDDAWANHASNAKACAEDRQRYQHLIDFLNANKKTTSP